MYSEEYLNRFEELITNAEFAAAANQVTDVEQLKNLFSEKGLNIEDDLAKAMYEKMASIRKGEELSIEDLELVAGGKINWTRVGCSALAGVMITASLATCNPKVIAIGVAGALVVTAALAKKDLKK